MARGRVALARRRGARAARALATRRPQGGAIGPIVFLGAFPPLFLAAYFLSDFDIGRRWPWALYYRYLMILHPYLAVTFAAALGACATTSVRRRAAAIVTGAICALCLAGTLGRLEFDRVDEHLADPGYSMNAFGRFVYIRYGVDRERLGAFVERFEAERPPAEPSTSLWMSRSATSTVSWCRRTARLQV
ncbi:MAG: hypothetical protein R3F34_00770 [Planctomycetota bacterium]